MLITKASRKSRRSSRRPFFHFFADDWLSGTRSLPDDQKALYVDFCALQWTLKGRLTAETLRLHLRWDPRKLRRCLDALIEVGKIEILAHGALSNPKMAQLIDEFQNRSYAQDAPHTESPNYPPTSVGHTPEVQDKSEQSIPESSMKSTNDAHLGFYPDTIYQNKTERLPPQPASTIEENPPFETAETGWRAGGGRGFNLSDLKTLEATLGETLRRLHGDAAWAAGFGEFAAKLADGEPIAKPAKLLAALVLARATRPAATPVLTPPETNRERTNRLVAESVHRRAAEAARYQEVH